MRNFREMRPYDARAFLEVHHTTVRGLTAKDCPQAVNEDWLLFGSASEPLSGKLLETPIRGP